MTRIILGFFHNWCYRLTPVNNPWFGHFEMRASIRTAMVALLVIGLAGWGVTVTRDKVNAYQQERKQRKSLINEHCSVYNVTTTAETTSVWVVRAVNRSPLDPPVLAQWQWNTVLNYTTDNARYTFVPGLWIDCWHDRYFLTVFLHVPPFDSKGEMVQTLGMVLSAVVIVMFSAWVIFVSMGVLYSLCCGRRSSDPIDECVSEVCPCIAPSKRRAPVIRVESTNNEPPWWISMAQQPPPQQPPPPRYRSPTPTEMFLPHRVASPTRPPSYRSRSPSVHLTPLSPPYQSRPSYRARDTVFIV